MTRIGVVGCGKIAEKHLSAYRKLGQTEIVVSDVVARGKTVAERYEVGWHPDPRALIHGDTVDAVDVCTPTTTHVDVILEALACGKHVFCEKPLARNLEEIEQIEACARDAGTTLMVGYLYRFHPAMQFARSVIREGIIGEPYFATFRLGGRGSHKAWKHKAHTGGGAGNEMLVHMLDLALWYFGEPQHVANLCTDMLVAQREIEGELVEATAEDLILLEMRTESGVRAFCQSDLVTPGYMNHIEVQGTNGSLFTSILDYLPTTVFCREARGNYSLGQNFFEFAKTDVFERELGHFLECVEGRASDGIHSVTESRRLMEILDAVLPQQRGHIRPYVRAAC